MNKKKSQNIQEIFSSLLLILNILLLPFTILALIFGIGDSLVGGYKKNSKSKYN